MGGSRAAAARPRQQQQGLGKSRGQLRSPETRPFELALSPRPFPVSIPPDRDEMLSMLRTSLLASTPGLHASYRDAPPSSSASSCGPESPVDEIDDEEDAQPEINSHEWETWIDWDRVSELRVDAMELDDRARAQ